MWSVFGCVLCFLLCILQTQGDLQRAKKESKYKTRVDDIMDELQGTCLRNNSKMTLKELLKDTKTVLKDIGVYKEIVKTNKKLREELNWIVSESKSRKELTRLVQLLKRDMRDECQKYPQKAVKDCSKLRNKKQSGVYNLKSDSGKIFKAYCNMDVDGGGWTVIQLRIDGSTNFGRTWQEYKDGFGDLKGEFWLGNENIHELTSNGRYELRIDLADWEGNKWYAVYKTFKIGGESSKYQLTVGGYSGTAGDSLARHNFQRFTTKDQDNDKWTKNCSVEFGEGGWWYKDCHYSSLNGYYGKGYGAKGVAWYTAKRSSYSMKFSRIMIRSY